MADLYKNYDAVNFDGLISDAVPQVVTGAGTIAHGAAEASYVRGTIFAKSGNGLAVLGANPAGPVTEDFSGNGTATTFTLSASPLPLAVTGAKVGTSDATVSAYNAQTGVVTLSAAPAAGTKNVHITYDNPAPDAPFGILCEDVTVGTTDDVNAVFYLAGTFDPAKVTAAEDYTVTAADVDALREVGIYFKAAQA